jgi:hypothetical protein
LEPKSVRLLAQPSQTLAAPPTVLANSFLRLVTPA